MNKKMAAIFTIAMFLPLVTYAENRSSSNYDSTSRARLADAQNHSPFQIMVDDATKLYTKVVKGPQGQVPSSVLENARCIAILPNVVTGAFVVGGTHGDGLASCKTNDNKWSHPAAITLSKGSIGLQAGVKSADLVSFLSD
jgi:lipid-binding SYLF domain-containing protein